MVKLIRKAVRSLGFDVVRYPPKPPGWKGDYLKLLSNYNIDLIFDIGANTGQYAEETFGLGYTGKIVSFEPMSKEHAQLVSKAGANPHWTIAPRMAIGDEDGEIEINISENSVSSSILPLTEYTMETSPLTRYVGKEKTAIARLDTIAGQYLKNYTNLFVKIDVQGYEAHVLKGAMSSIDKIKGLHIEFSLQPLYDREVNMMAIMNKVHELGFRPHYFMPHITIDKIGRMLQVDGIFFRTS